MERENRKPDLIRRIGKVLVASGGGLRIQIPLAEWSAKAARRICGTKALCLLVMGMLLPMENRTQAALSAQDAQVFAQRFRPYLKTTLADGELETARPCSWQWFVGSCNLEDSSDDVVVPQLSMAADPSALLQPPGADVTVAHAGANDPGYTLHLAADVYQDGEPWIYVIHDAHGVYAHVEEVDNTLVNIEYTILWAFNRATANDHDGDITSITVVYDRGCDRLTRVTYSLHGVVLESFRLAQPVSIELVQLIGTDQNLNAATVSAAKLSVGPSDSYEEGEGLLSASDPYVYLARDPVSLRFEHPVIYAENGAHEPWPNSTGWEDFAPAHTGDGLSFLPDSVHVLGTLLAPNLDDVPFLRYNGTFGTDPAAIIFHRSWFWPQGRTNNPYGIPESRFSDSDPYVTHDNLLWPPSHEFEGVQITMFVDWRVGTAFDGSAASPFPDPMTADSFLPKGGTLSVAAGHYAGPAILSRACTVVASSGPVVLGQP